MNDFYVEKPFPGTNSCILVGRVQADAIRNIGPMERLLWIVDDETLMKEVERLFAGYKHWERLSIAKRTNWQETLRAFLLKTPRLMPAFYVTKQIPSEFQADYTAAIESVVAFLEEEHRARVTRQQDAFAWQCNLIDNMADYMDCRLPDSWRGALTGVPAFVCGAGPSFAVSAPALARMADRGVVFAGDSSLKALSNLGVRADFTVSVDVAKTAAKCIPQGVMAPSRAILTAISPPDWSSALPRQNRYYLSGNQITLDWMAAQGVSKTASSVCENCGATAIELAHFMGCAPIYIFGMDLSLSQKGSQQQRHHEGVDATTYENSGFNIQQEFPKVPGNFEAEVPTHVIGDWRALDQRIASYTTGQVVIVSDRGAKLRNTVIVRPEEFTLPAAVLDKKVLLGRLPAPQRIQVPLSQQIASKLARFGEMLHAVTPALKELTQAGNLQETVQRLRHILVDPANGMILGAYSFKLMPYLFPPLETDPAFWNACLLDLDKLARLYIEQARALEENVVSSKR